MALAGALPLLVVSPIGGVIADRATRKTVIQLAQAYNVVSAVLLAVLAAGWFGLHLEFWYLFLTASHSLGRGGSPLEHRWRRMAYT